MNAPTNFEIISNRNQFPLIWYVYPVTISNYSTHLFFSICINYLLLLVILTDKDACLNIDLDPKTSVDDPADASKEYQLVDHNGNITVDILMIDLNVDSDSENLVHEHPEANKEEQVVDSYDNVSVNILQINEAMAKGKVDVPKNKLPRIQTVDPKKWGTKEW